MIQVMECPGIATELIDSSGKNKASLVISQASDLAFEITHTPTNQVYTFKQESFLFSTTLYHVYRGADN